MSATKLSGDSVRAYLRDIGRIPLLEHDEEILLGRKVQRLMWIQEQQKEHNCDDQSLSELLNIPEKQLKRECVMGKSKKMVKPTTTGCLCR